MNRIGDKEFIMSLHICLKTIVNGCVNDIGK